MVATPFKPAWAKYEKDIRSGDAKKARLATEAFTQTREKELKNDATLRRWEKSRKESVAKDKPKWVKERIKKEEAERLKPFTFFKQAGSFEEEHLYPAPGYLIVYADISDDHVTDAGIILNNAQALDNRGTCMAIGGPQILDHNNQHVVAPCQAGDKILYKLGAGLTLKLGEKDYRFMQFSDVLGIIE